MKRRKKAKPDRDRAEVSLEELMDSFQPAKDSLADPSFRSLADAIAFDPGLKAKFGNILSQDEEIRRRMHAAPSPPGLPEAILAAVENRFGVVAPPSVSEDTEPPSWENSFDHSRSEATSQNALAGAASLRGGNSAHTESLKEVAGEILTELSVRRGAFASDSGIASWRSRIAAGLTLTLVVAALLFCAGWPLVWSYGGGRAERWDLESILQLAIAKFQAEAEVFGSGKPLAEKAPPYALRPSPAVRGAAHARWRAVTLGPGLAAVAFDIPPVGGARATLYVFRGKVASAPPAPPEMPQLNTATCSAGLWEESGLVMVLTVAGATSAYRQFLVTEAGPWA